MAWPLEAARAAFAGNSGVRTTPKCNEAYARSMVSLIIDACPHYTSVQNVKKKKKKSDIQLSSCLGPNSSVSGELNESLRTSRCISTKYVRYVYSIAGASLSTSRREIVLLPQVRTVVPTFRMVFSSCTIRNMCGAVSFVIDYFCFPTTYVPQCCACIPKDHSCSWGQSTVHPMTRAISYCSLRRRCVAKRGAPLLD